MYRITHSMIYIRILAIAYAQSAQYAIASAKAKLG